MMLAPFYIVFVVVLATLFLRWYSRRRIVRETMSKLPGPPSTFLIGNMKSAIMLTYNKNLLQPYGVLLLQLMIGYTVLYRKHGFFAIWMSSIPVVSVFSPDLAELILNSNISLEKSFEYTFLHRWLGQGLLTSTDSKWRSRRKLLTPSFHFRILEDFLPVFNDQSIVLVHKLKTTSDKKESVDIAPLVVLCTLDIVCETVMGVRIGAQNGSNSEYVAAVHSLGQSFGNRTAKPWLFSDFIFYNLSSDGKSFKKDLKIVHGFTQKVIRDKKEAILKQDKEPNTEEKEASDLHVKKRRALMDLLLDLQLQEADIQEEVDTFMFEGHDTTALGITYALYCVGLYPEVQNKLVEELDSIFGNDVQRPITMDDARDMKYMESVLKESQRIYPSVPLIGRRLHEDVHYEGRTIPKGAVVHMNIIALHRNPVNFSNPEVFDPERFSPENSVKRHPFAFIPFSAGPRNCIGQKFAMLEEKVVIGNILRHFRVSSLDPRDKIHVCLEFTLKSTSSIRMTFAPRR